MCHILEISPNEYKQVIKNMYHCSCLFYILCLMKRNDPDPKTLFLDEVKVGETYEMVVSTMSGFYRYRFGDVIKVVDFYYKLPVVKFLYR